MSSVPLPLRAAGEEPTPHETGLVRYDAMCRAIDAAYEVDEVKAIHDHAAMLQAAARVAHNIEAETRAYEIRMRAARKAGELSKQIEKAQGQRSDLVQPSDEVKPTKMSVLSGAGISKQQASEWERLSEVPANEFEAALAIKSVHDLIEKPPPVSSGALALYGILRQFEWRGLLEKPPEEFMETMTEWMRGEVRRLAPLAIAWLSTIKESDNGRINGGSFSGDSAAEHGVKDQSNMGCS